MTRRHASAWARGLIAAAALCAGPALAEEGLPCLWDSLTTAEKTRLELAARIGDSPPEALLKRWGEQRFAEHFQRCDLPLEEPVLARGARYLSARAKSETLSAALIWEGVAPKQAVGALDQVAGMAERRVLAQDIMALENRATDGPASFAVRGAARLIVSTAPPDRRAALSILAAEWASARILSDGLSLGATPPAPETGGE